MPFLPDDIDITYEWFSDPAYWRGAEMKSLNAYSKTMMRRADDSDWTIWAVMRREPALEWERGEGPRELIGYTSLSDFRFGRLARNSFAYLVPQARGNGYGREVVALRCSYAFNFLGMEMLETTTMTDNLAARRILASVGYECTGKIVRDDYFDGAWRDALIYVLFRDQFRPVAGREEQEGAAGEQ